MPFEGKFFIGKVLRRMGDLDFEEFEAGDLLPERSILATPGESLKAMVVLLLGLRFFLGETGLRFAR